MFLNCMTMTDLNLETQFLLCIFPCNSYIEIHLKIWPRHSQTNNAKHLNIMKQGTTILILNKRNKYEASQNRNLNFFIWTQISNLFTTFIILPRPHDGWTEKCIWNILLQKFSHALVLFLRKWKINKGLPNEGNRKGGNRAKVRYLQCSPKESYFGLSSLKWMGLDWRPFFLGLHCWSLKQKRSRKKW